MAAADRASLSGASPTPIFFLVNSATSTSKKEIIVTDVQKEARSSFEALLGISL